MFPSLCLVAVVNLIIQNKRTTIHVVCLLPSGELQRRNEIIRSINKKIKLLEAQQQDRKVTLESTQQQLQEACLKASETDNHCQDLEVKLKHQ